MKVSFYEELEHVFDKFPKYHLLGDFNGKVGREDIFKPTIWNESLHEIRNDNGVRVVKFGTSKILLSKVRCFHIVASKVRCFHIVAFINLSASLLMERRTIRLTIF
jgi:hypothetical protein